MQLMSKIYLEVLSLKERTEQQLRQNLEMREYVSLQLDEPTDANLSPNYLFIWLATLRGNHLKQFSYVERAAVKKNSTFTIRGYKNVPLIAQCKKKKKRVPR
jgi:hypothetical protein